jgi:hypothetical protein
VLTRELAIAAVGFVAGLAGTWSPCGFSMVDTIGRAATAPATRAAACGTFALGALAGGAATFGTLAAAGRLVHGAGGALAAVGIAATAALGEARGVRIVPQIRRQVPEPWRRLLPLPVAAAAYGVLLGLGFTTFVLTLGVWALAAISFAVGDLRLGLDAGLAFGAGRALPVAALVPIAERPLGLRAAELMTARGGLRLSRAANAVALAVCAAAFAASGARAAVVVAHGATDPTAAGGLLGWETGVQGVIRLGPGRLMTIGGTDPALGGRYLAWIDGSTVHVVDVQTLQPVLGLTVPGVDEIAVSDRWLVYRAQHRLVAHSLVTAGLERTVAAVRPAVDLGRPAVSGDVVVYASATTRSTAIYADDLAGGGRRVLRRSDLVQLSNPSILGRRLLYIRTTNLDQRLMLGPFRGRSRTLYRLGPPAQRDSGYERGHSHHTRTPPARPPSPLLLWTTALAPETAYVSLIPRNGRRAPARIIAVRR